MPDLVAVLHQISPKEQSASESCRQRRWFTLIELESQFHYVVLCDVRGRDSIPPVGIHD
jgi:hypothetical protein